MNTELIKGMKMNYEDGYERINALPDDPADSVVFVRSNDSTSSLLISYPVPAEYTMPFGDKQALIDQIHSSLMENQGLIEVNSGNTADGHRYIYSIVKTYFEENKALQYFVYMEVEYEEESLRLEGNFQEAGNNGVREAEILKEYIIGGKVSADLAGWEADPYDAEYKRGILMNLSEKEEYDDKYPCNALSEARRYVRCIIG